MNISTILNKHRITHKDQKYICDDNIFWKCKLLSGIWFSVTPWTVAHQAPLSTEFSRQDTEVGCHSLLQWIFLTQGLNFGLLHYRRFFTVWAIRDGKGFFFFFFLWLNHKACGIFISWSESTVLTIRSPGKSTFLNCLYEC